MYNNFTKFPQGPNPQFANSAHSSAQNSPNFRSEFLSNANASSDSVNHHHQHHPNDNIDVDDSFTFNTPPNNNFTFTQPYLPLKNSSTTSNPLKKSSSANVNDYELSSLNRNQNPFGDDGGYLPQSDPRYSAAPSNPFAQPAIPDKRFDPGNRELPLPPPSAEQLEHEKLKKNEKNRLKQIRRHPRFHYTKLPYFTMIVTLIQVIVFIVELVKMSSLTGSAFQTKPYFNPMLGPSTYVLINMGARYVPCMHKITNITDDLTINFPCPNSTLIETNVCSLNELCGLDGLPIHNDAYQPDQWYRIITPIFLHAGFLHIIFNLLLQVTMGATIERAIGSIKYFVIYLASGIGGFLLGANFSPNGMASTGASGSLFGIMATNIILFVFSGRKNHNLYGTNHYALFIFIMIGEIIISLVLGLLPGLDNFSHIGGFACGLLLAVLLLPDPFFCYQDGIITYNAHDGTMQQFLNNWNPMHNFEDKIPVRVYCWFSARVVALVLFILYYAMLAKNFFTQKLRPLSDTCKWCKYINCIPVHGWCEIGQVSVDDTTTTPSSTSNSNETGSSQGLQGIKNQKRSRNYQQEKLAANARAFQPSIENDSIVHKQINSGHSFVNDQNSGLGLGFCFIIAFFTYRFCKQKKIL